MSHRLSLALAALLMTPSVADACVRICNVKTGECECVTRFQVDGTVLQPVEQDIRVQVTPESFDLLKSHLNAEPRNHHPDSSAR